MEGFVLEQDTVTAEELFQKGEACFNAGHVKEAVAYFQQAADLGHERAKKVLDTAGRPLSKKAFAKRNWAVSEYNQGLLAYREGQWEKAFSYFRGAAERGLAEAQFTLSVLYAGGRGTGQNLEEALRWAQEAAAQGHEKAEGLVPVLQESLRK